MINLMFLMPIYSNLRGADSKDQYFQQLPRILMLSYQGSQNSTSQGILKVSLVTQLLFEFQDCMLVEEVHSHLSESCFHSSAQKALNP